MAGFKFFYPDGTVSTSKDDFIDFYSKVYFLRNRDKELERKIEHILYKDSLTKADLAEILKWKTGGEIVGQNKDTVNYQYGTIAVRPISEYLNGEKSAKLSNNEIELLNCLKGYDKIGSVYAITLLYFLSKGLYPIYDRFAHLAIKALSDDNIKFPDTISDTQLKKEVPIDSTNTEKIWKGYKKFYCDRINTIFEERSKERIVDQALWAYGHLFNENIKNKNASL